MGCKVRVVTILGELSTLGSPFGKPRALGEMDNPLYAELKSDTQNWSLKSDAEVRLMT